MTTAEILFGGQINTVNAAKLSAAIGVTPNTIRNWKKDPDTIPWGKMKLIARVRRLTGDDFEKMAKARK